jgi:hypothetical protein
MAIKFNRSQTFATNGTVDAPSLHNLVDGLDIYQSLITDQANVTSVSTADELLIALAAGSEGDAPKAVTVQELFQDALTAGTYTNANISEALTYGTATGNRTVSTSATITTGTITTGVIPTLTSSTATFGTTTSTAATITSGTITNLASTTGTIATLNSTTGTIATLNSTTGTITNLSTTLAGDFTISSGTGTLGTTGVTAGTYGGATSVPILTLDTKGRVTTASTSAITSGLTGFRNRIINGEFGVAQRATSFVSGANDDDSYNLDRWYVLSDGNDAVDITQTTTEVPSNQLTAIALDVETANKKFGIAQIIEQKNCIGLIGGNVTLSFKAKVSSTTKLDNVKAAVVAWSGTADTVTSDIISAWGAEGTNPTLIANATFENTPANLNVTTSYATYTLTANVDTASTKNLIVFIWSDVTDTTAGDFLYITDVQLEAGSTATDFERRPIGTELAMCQRYFCKPATDGNSAIASGYFHSATSFRAVYQYPVTMRSSPTSITVGTAGNLYAQSTANYTASAITTILASNQVCLLGVTVSGATGGQSGALLTQTADPVLIFSSEL